MLDAPHNLRQINMLLMKENIGYGEFTVRRCLLQKESSVKDLFAMFLFTSLMCFCNISLSDCTTECWNEMTAFLLSQAQAHGVRRRLACSAPLRSLAPFVRRGGICFHRNCIQHCQAIIALHCDFINNPREQAIQRLSNLREFSAVNKCTPDH